MFPSFNKQGLVILNAFYNYYNRLEYKCNFVIISFVSFILGTEKYPINKDTSISI